MKPLSGPHGLFTVSVQPEFLIDSSSPGWRGAYFVELRAAPEGQSEHLHRNFALQRLMSTMQVRRLGARTFETLPPSVSFWRPGHEQVGSWRNGGLAQFLFVSPDRAREIIERRIPQQVMRAGREILPAPMVYRILDALTCDLHDGSPAGPIVGDSLLTALLAHLAALPPLGGRVHFPAARRQRVLDYIDAHLDAAPGLDDLAREAGLSVRHFTRSFRASVGLSPHQYVLQRRVERAKALIVDGMSLMEVAAACGFRGQGVLSRTFTRIVGETPREYRSRFVRRRGPR